MIVERYCPICHCITRFSEHHSMSIVICMSCSTEFDLDDIAEDDDLATPAFDADGEYEDYDGGDWLFSTDAEREGEL